MLPKLRWASDETDVRTVTLSFPFRSETAQDCPRLSVVCREFVPREGIDILIDVWEGDNGERLVLKFPAWAIVGLTQSDWVQLEH